MATIPLGPGVRVAPEVVQNRVITPDPGLQSRGAQQLASQVQSAAMNVLEKQKREDQALARVKASNALFERETQISTINNDLAEQVRLGTLSYDKLDEAYQGAVSKLEPLQVTGLSEAEVEGMGLAQQRLQLAGQDSIRKLAISARTDAAKGELATLFDSVGKNAGMPGANIDQLNAYYDTDAADSAGRLAYGALWPAKKQEAKDANWTTQATQRVVSARDGLGTLKQIEHDLTAADGFYAGKLDPEKRNQLLNTVTGRIYQVQAHQQQQAMVRKVKAERVLAQMDKQASLGVPPTVADQQRWKAALQGTSAAGEYDTYIKQMNESQHFLQLPEAQQELYLTQLKANMQKNGASAAQVENVNRLENVRDQRNKLRDSDPITYSAITNGTQVEPISLAGVATPEGQQQLLGQLGERFLVAASVRRQAGMTVTPSPWTEAERSMIQAAAKSIGDEAKLQIFGVIGAATQDKAEYAAAIQPFVGDDKLADTAGRAAYQGYKLSDGSSLAQTLMEGRKILADKSKPMPTDDMLLKGFDKEVGFSMPAGSDQRERGFQAYKAVYAALSERESKTFNGATIDSGISKKAVQAATGGVTNWAGSKVIKPYGMSDSDFATSVGTQIDAMAERTKLPADLLKSMPLMAAPRRPGYYFLMNGGEAQRDPQTLQELMVKP